MNTEHFYMWFKTFKTCECNYSGVTNHRSVKIIFNVSDSLFHHNWSDVISEVTDIYAYSWLFEHSKCRQEYRINCFIPEIQLQRHLIEVGPWTNSHHPWKEVGNDRTHPSLARTSVTEHVTVCCFLLVMSQTRTLSWVFFQHMTLPHFLTLSKNFWCQNGCQV